MVSLKGILKGEDMAMALGAATAGTVRGFIPLDLDFVVGGTEMAIGFAGQKFLGKRGFLKNYFRGIWISGLSNFIASLIPQFTGTMPTTKARMQTQVDGSYGHAEWKAPGPPVYIRRNPIENATTERPVAPTGTRHLGRTAIPRIPDW